jgi:hypothetical protein
VKKAIGVLTVITLLFSFSQVCNDSSQAASEPPVIDLTIRYNGFCDGVRMTIDFGTGLVVGNATGCYSHHYLGTVGSVRHQGGSVTLTLSDDSDFPGIIYVIRGDGTWTNYDEENGEIVVVNSGTWSLVGATTANEPSDTAQGSADY